MPKSLSILTSAVAAAIAASPSPAQPAIEPPVSSLEPVIATVEDISPLLTTLQQPQDDARDPLGFSRVYRSSLLPGQFVRASGALWAVFPKSEYVAVQDEGIRAVVPENAVFYIGGPPDYVIEASRRPAPRVSPLRRNTRLDLGLPDGELTFAAPPARLGENVESPQASHDGDRVLGGPATTVWSSEFYRQVRMAELLTRAGATPR